MINELIRIAVFGLLAVAILYLVYYLMFEGAIYDFREDTHRPSNGSVKEAIETIKKVKEMSNQF